MCAYINKHFVVKISQENNNKNLQIKNQKLTYCKYYSIYQVGQLTSKVDRKSTPAVGALNNTLSSHLMS